jgi:hypothetical protein
MSIPPDTDAKLLGGIDYANFNELLDTVSLEIKTNQVDSNSTVQFRASEEEDIVDEVTQTPDNTDLLTKGRLVVVRINIPSGSSDSDISIYQSENFDEINQVVRIEGLDQADSPEAFNLNGAFGVPFLNKQGDNQLYIQIDENSGIATKYELDIYWYNI